jgi:putative DNA primase/helicase
MSDESELAGLAEEMRQESNARLANGGERVELPPPSDPMAVARLYVAKCCTRDNVLTSQCWGGSWWSWLTTHWVELHEREVASLLYLFTENAIFINADGDPQRWSPTRHKISDLREALAAITHS